LRDNKVRMVKVSRVIDGDTFVGTLFLIDQVIQFNDQHFRLMGIDTPERGENGYKEATEFLRKVINEQFVFCQIHGKDAFGRWLVDLYTETSEKTVNEALLVRGLADVYI
jgi:micrococcal nuclease